MNEPQPSAERLIEIFNEAKTQPTGDQRRRFLEEACGGDASLVLNVEQLLRDDDEAGSFLHAGAAVSTELEAEYARLKPEDPGDRVGHYKLLQQIGQGGFGVVWMAEQTQPVQRRVALKIIKLGMDTKEVVARFEQERQALAMMDHPNIARVFDAGATPTGRPYFVMELVRGIKITDYCDQANLATNERLQLFIAVCHAVQHAHQKGVIHRDLKPSNILVTLHDGVAVPKVIDFGVAKATQSQRLTELTLFTQFQQMIGTPLYMSPEQAEMSGLDIDTRSDIYSLGVLLYELLVGRTPFDPERILKAGHDEMRRLIREEDPPKPSTALSTMQAEMRTAVARHRHTDAAKIARLLRGELDWIVMKALEKDRTRRYETATGFAADVQRYLADEPVAACPPSTIYRLKKFARRNKAGLAVAALVLVFLVLAASAVGWAVRDRTGRVARIAAQVKVILSEVDKLELEQKWAEALVAARGAEAAAIGGEADAATTQAVREKIKELEFIERLEGIRMQRATWIGWAFNVAGANTEYGRAFREYGVDLDELPTETSVQRLKPHRALIIPLTAALDDWIFTRQLLDPAGTSRLLTVVRGIDSDPLRDRMRATWGRPAAEVEDELRRLAESIDLRAQHPASLASLGKRLQRVKLLDSAIHLLRNAQRVYPADFWLNFDLAWLLAERKDHAGAIRFYTAAISIRPRATAALNNLALNLGETGEVEEAIAAFRRAIEIDPQFAIGYINIARKLRDQNKLDDSIAMVSKAIELEPKSASAYETLGMTLRAQKKPREAVAALRKAAELNPKDVGICINLGTVLGDLREYHEAIDWFRKASEHSPKSALPYINIGATLSEQGKHDAALENYRKAIELEPSNPRVHFQLGVGLYLQDDKYAEAVKALQKAIELDPKHTQAHDYLGRCLMHLGKLNAAVAASRKALELGPKDAVTYYYCAIVILWSGATAEAISVFRKAIEVDPKSALAHSGLGMALHARGNLAEALAAHERAVALDPQDSSVHSSLAWLLVTGSDPKFHDPKRAVALAQRAIELSPAHAGHVTALGIAQYRAHDWNAAVATLQKAMELRNGGDGREWFFLAMAHWQLGNRDEARQWHTKAVQWIKKIHSANDELLRFRTEAAELLGVSDRK